MNSAWGGLNVALIILPYLNTDASGTCSTLPVHLLSFTSQRNNNDINLNWTIADEIGMKGYEVQRSSNNGAYSTVAYVPALNNNKNQGYSVTDKMHLHRLQHFNTALSKSMAMAALNIQKYCRLNQAQPLTMWYLLIRLTAPLKYN